MTYKRGGVWWIKFQHQGRMIYRSSGQTSRTKARQIEARLRSELALGHYGILTRKAVPTLAEFCSQRVEPWARSTFEQPSPKTWLWYRFGLDALKKSGLCNAKLDEIGPEQAAEYASARQRDGLQISSVNTCLRCLRRVLKLAEEWNVILKAPKVQFLSGERQRDGPARKHGLHNVPATWVTTSGRTGCREVPKPGSPNRSNPNHNP
jgi:hypothetical protein